MWANKNKVVGTLHIVASLHKPFAGVVIPTGASLVVKNPPAHATHSNILAWEIPWTEPGGGGLQSMGLQKNQTRLSIVVYDNARPILPRGYITCPRQKPRHTPGLPSSCVQA